MLSEAIRVLLVEDNPSDAQLVLGMLRASKGARFDAEHAPRLSDALALLGKTEFHILILDLSLPDADGVEAIAKIRGAAPRIPIITLSGQGDIGAEPRALQEGVQDDLVKDELNGHVLLRTLRYAIERRNAEESFAEVEGDLKGVLGALPAMALRVGADGRVHYLSRELSPGVPMIGVDRVEKCFPPRVAEEVVATIAAVLERGDVRVVSYEGGPERQRFEARIAPRGERDVVVLVRRL